MMEYKGYHAEVEYDDEAEIFHGEVIDLRDVITFEADNVKDLKAAFVESVEDYLEFCQERGEEPERPYSGRFLVRADSELHKRIYISAKRSRKSLNSWIVEVLNEAASQTENTVTA